MTYLLYSQSYQSILKAVLFSKTFPDCVPYPKENYQSSLFSSEPYFDIDAIDFEKIYSTYVKKNGKILWLSNKKHTIPASRYEHHRADLLRRKISAAFRNSKEDKFSIIEESLIQAFDKGIDYVLHRTSQASMKLHKLYMQVIMEAHKCRGFIRLSPFENRHHKVLVGYYEPTHNTADMVARHLADRFSGYKIMVRTPEVIYFHDQKELRQIPADQFSFADPVDNFADLWETYHNSAYIPERYNRKYAMSMIPKKYWSWVKEGIKIDKPFLTGQQA